MMVNCPKCGFAQPKDQFCAKCGVDMVAFRPPEQPLSKKLLSSWIFQVAVFALVGLSAYYFIRGRTHASFEQQLAETESAPTSVAQESSQSGFNSSTTTSAAADEAPAVSGATTNSAQAQAAAPQGAQQQFGASVNSQSAPPPEQQGAAGLQKAAEATLGERGAGATSALVRSVRVQFLEAQRTMISELNRNTVNLASYGTNFTGGVVNDLGTRLPDFSRSMRSLDAPLEYPIQLNQPIVIFKGMRDEESGTNIGLTIQITPSGNTEAGVQLQVEVLRVLKDQSGQVADQNFQDSFVVPKEGGAYMAGIFARRAPTDAERALYANASVLKILTSPNFVEQQTDFLLLIHAK